MDMELSMARCIASFTKDESLFGSAVPTILQNFCGLKDTPYFWQNNKEEAVRQIRLCLKGLPSADKKWELVAKLSAEEHRAKRGTLTGIKDIYSGLLSILSEEQLNQLAKNMKSDIDNLFRQAKVHVHSAVAGASGKGKTTSFQIAAHVIMFGYPPVQGTHSNIKLQEVLHKNVVKTEWIDDCTNHPRNDKGEYAYVSFYYSSTWMCIENQKESDASFVTLRKQSFKKNKFSANLCFVCVCVFPDADDPHGDQFGGRGREEVRRYLPCCNRTIEFRLPCHHGPCG